MRVVFGRRFIRQLESLPLMTQRIFRKQLRFLSQDLRHPSLHAKKYNARYDLWQARVDRDVRFYFQIEEDTISLVEIRHHPK
ncbi:hypothetical protein HY375_00055 [Candidatus Berkelbacteria bacterium]|nr:hypothetical protein [Candidatus Berkelbacteria bacterium]